MAVSGPPDVDPLPNAVVVRWCENEFGHESMRVVASTKKIPGEAVEIKLVYGGMRRKESSGIVYTARCECGSEDNRVAVKALNRDARAMSNELQILKMLEHSNTVELKYFFYTVDNSIGSLHLVMENMSKTMDDVIRYCKEVEQEPIPLLAVKLCMYQLFRGLAHIHWLGICHGDVKPANILVDPERGVVKLSGFGCAIEIRDGGAMASPMGSLHYRALELLYGASDYTTNVDIWSAGCVLAELFLGKPIFRGNNVLDQRIEIYRVFGTLGSDVIEEINPEFVENAPYFKRVPFESMFLSCKPPLDGIRLCAEVLEPIPSFRSEALALCTHSFFGELREKGKTLKNDVPLPKLFDWTAMEVDNAVLLEIDNILLAPPC